MRIIKSGEKHYTCKHCQSILALLPKDIHTVGPAGPYDMDYDDDAGKQYWICMVCKTTNWLSNSPDVDDY